MKKKIQKLSDINSLIHKGYKVYSFDIFDTLLSRCLPPEHVKILSSQYLKNRFPEQLSRHTCLDIYKIRKRIESSLEEERARQGHDRDYSFNQCMGLLVEKLFGAGDPEIRQDIISFEISLEIAVASAHTDAAALLESLKKKGKRIICVSDMYLGGRIISEILQAHGLFRFIDAVYVSSDLMKRKDTGNLFRHVLFQEGCQPSEVLHIGDNRQTDVAIPGQYGIHTVHFSSPVDPQRYEKISRSLQDGSASGITVDRLVNALVTDFEFSRPAGSGRLARTLAYPFISYIHGLIDFCREKSIREIYFLSREGLFFKNLFAVISEEAGSDFHAEYLYVSRKSLFILSIPDLTPENIEKILNYCEKHYYIKMISLSQILNMLMINNRETRRICMHYAIHPDGLLKTSESKELIKTIFSDIKIKNIYAKQHHAYAEIFSGYLVFLGMPREGRVAFSDMGWSGSMQTYMQELLAQNNYQTRIHGYYFGYDETIDQDKHGIKNSDIKSGLFCYRNSPNNNDMREKKIINNFTLELISIAPHGTVVSYRDTGEKIEPVCADDRREIRQYNHFSRDIQEYVLQFARRYNKLLSIMQKIYSGNDIHEYILNACYNLFTNPDIQTAKTISKLYFIDDFFGKKHLLRFRTAIWWPEALHALREDRKKMKNTIYMHQNTAKQFFLLLSKVFDVPSKLLDAWYHTKSYRYCRNKATILSQNLFDGRIYGLREYVTVKLHKRYGKLYINDRKLNLIKTYYFKKNQNIYHRIRRGYIFIANIDPRSGKKTGALAKNLSGLKLDKVSVIFYHAGRYTLLTIKHRYQLSYEKISDKEAARLISDNEFLVTINDGVVLDRDFIHEVEKNLEVSHADALYCDNDTIYKQLYYTNPKFKPCWSRYSYFEYDYIGPVIAVRTARVTEHLDRFMLSYEKWGARGAVISILENLEKIEHIPGVLYHDNKYDRESSCKPVNEYFIRNGIHAHAGQKGRYSSVVTFSRKDDRLITIIIPFKDKSDYLKRCVESIIEKTEYSNYEILLVNNNSTEEKTASYLERLANNKKIRIIEYNFAFNYSALNNYAAGLSNARHIVFLNNDTEILRGDWLDRLLDYAHLPGTGCVGAKLIYPDGRIQHGGIIFNFNYQYPAANQFSQESRYSRGYLNKLTAVQNYSAVAAACMMTRRELFLKIGGFDESFAVAYNDLDLCCRLRHAGFDIIWNPHVEIIHHEFVSRGNPLSSETDIRERDLFVARWKDFFISGDPHHSPFLNLSGGMAE